MSFHKHNTRSKRKQSPDNQNAKRARKTIDDEEVLSSDNKEDHIIKPTRKSARTKGGNLDKAPQKTVIAKEERIDEDVEIAGDCLIREDGGGHARFRKKQLARPAKRIDVE